MVGWHANNEPTQAQQLYNTVGPIENNLVGPLLGDGWCTNDKFTKAKPEAVVGKWFSWDTIGKADISDSWPTVTPQLASVGPTIVCYMGNMNFFYSKRIKL